MRRLAFIAEVHLANGELVLFTHPSSGIGATKKTDNPPNKKIYPYLKQIGIFESSMFSGARVTGGIKANAGSIQLVNKNGIFDEWAEQVVEGSKVVIRYGYVGDDYPSGFPAVLISYVTRPEDDKYTINFALKDRTTLFDAPIANRGFRGTGGIEGPSSGIGKPWPFISSDPGMAPAILIDRNKQIYFAGGNATWTFDIWKWNTGVEVNFWDVFDNGIEIDRVDSIYPTVEALFNDPPPAPGTVKYYFGPNSKYLAGYKDGPVLFRLGSPAEGDIRVFVHGVPTDADTVRNGGFVFGSFTIESLSLRAGLFKRDLHANTAFVAIGAIHVDDNSSFRAVFDDACASLQAYYGMTMKDKLKCGYLKDPESEDFYYGTTQESAVPIPTVSKRTFHEHELKNFKRSFTPGNEGPVATLKVNQGQVWNSQLAGGVSAYVRDLLTRDTWESSWQGANVIKPGYISAILEFKVRQYQNAFGRDLMLQRYFALFAGLRRYFVFDVNFTPEIRDLELEIGDVVILQVPRYGMEAGKKFRIIMMRLDCDAATPRLTLGVWGGETGVYQPANPPGVIDPGVDPRRAQYALGDFRGFMYATVESPPVQLSRSAAQFGDFRGYIYATVTPAPASDPHFSNVICLLHFEGADESTSYVDSSSYARSVGFTAATIEVTGALVGSSSLEIVNAGDRVIYNGGTEGIWGTQECTVEIYSSIVASGSQPTAFPCLFRIMGQFGPGWATDAFAIHANHSSPYNNVVTVWCYNFSTSVPLLVGTTNIMGAGPTKVKVTREAANVWKLRINDIVEATATWSGAANTTARYRFVGGEGSYGAKGLHDELRETVGVARTTVDSLPFFDS